MTKKQKKTEGLQELLEKRAKAPPTRLGVEAQRAEAEGGMVVLAGGERKDADVLLVLEVWLVKGFERDDARRGDEATW